MQQLPFNIFISDDGAKRDLKLDLNMHYVHNETRLGAFPNLRSALLLGDAPYVCYCADDDYLMERELREGIRFLESHPAVVAYFAPCQLFDEVGQAPNWDAFYVATDETFTDAGKLWNFIIHNHVWPEHAIYRREHLKSILTPVTSAYWAFSWLATAFRAGPVHFARKPYYRNITNHPVGHRSKLGDEQCLTDFDNYRAGLECLAYDLFGSPKPELKAKLQAMINHFINMRLGVAHKLRTLQGNAAEAQVIEKRLSVCA